MIPSLADLLAQIADHGADSLQLRADQVPAVLIDREARPLPGPALSVAAMSSLVDETLSAEQRVVLERDGRLDAELHAPRLGWFEVRARRLPTGLAMAFRPRPRGGAEARAEPPSDAPEAVTAGPGSGGHGGATHKTGAPGVGAASAAVASGVAAPVTSSDGWPTDLPGLLREVIARQGSDLVLSTGTEAAVRIGGEMRAVPGVVFGEAELRASLGDLLSARREAELEARGSIDLAYETSFARFRVNVFRQRGGLAAVFRPIWELVPTFAELGLPPEIASLGAYPYGLVLMTGPTGMGKSTTLSALIEHVNTTRSLHIVTLEDPIEYLFRRKKSLIHQREIGVHVESFSSGLRAALRESPDIIFVGEMRDPETISAALTAAETGHLVLSTLHCGTPAQAVDRIIDTFPEHQQAQVRIQLADVARAIVAQRLVPAPDGKNRVPVVELIRITYAFSNLIRDRKTHLFPTQIQSSRQDGSIPFDESLAKHVRAGRIAMEDALRVCRDTTWFKAMVDADR